MPDTSLSWPAPIEKYDNSANDDKEAKIARKDHPWLHLFRHNDIDFSVQERPTDRVCNQKYK
jgi:hypothetical protein